MKTSTAQTSKRLLRVAVATRVTIVAIALLFAPLAAPARNLGQGAEPGLVAHEWGTFTSIAGKDGQALQWLPLTAPTASPAFVHRDLQPVGGLPGFVYHAGFGVKFALAGSIRMETPVLYFYSNRDLTLSVRVSFAKGLITEWYPKASQVTPAEDARADFLYKDRPAGIIGWDAVTLAPGQAAELPREAYDSRYYAARNTASTPLRVSTDAGNEHEKFLFYRGVSAAPVPISAHFTEVGTLLVKTTIPEAIPNIMLIERRGERLGFHSIANPQTETPIETPELTSSSDALAAQLEDILVARGLYRDEAHAMLETWGDSWFEEGSRLIYILPVSWVDAILPLTINPVPAQTVRVFVGRVELISPATQTAVKNAVVSNDLEALGKYCRFMWPILDVIEEKNPGIKTQASDLMADDPCYLKAAGGLLRQRTSR